MNVKLIFSSIISAIFFSSCTNLLDLQKRHYRSGYYLHTAASNKDRRSSISDPDKTKSEARRSQEQEIQNTVKSKETPPNKKTNLVVLNVTGKSSWKGAKIHGHNYGDTSVYQKKPERDGSLENDDDYVKKAKKAKTKRRIYSL